MAIVFGLIAYIGLVALIIGYFFAKKAGDRRQVQPVHRDLQE